jgi:SulP family sulfate permease
LNQWLPKSVLCLRDYNRQKFVLDLIAGVTVGLVALPLAMAFSIASGLSPQAGIYCAVVTGFIISALGGSKTQIGGPTGAFVVVVAGIVAQHGVTGLFVCTTMAGVILVILGATGLGTAVKFIPRPVVVGFTNGIAVLIASTQVKDFFGIQLATVPGEFLKRAEELARNFHTLSLETSALAGVALAVIVLFARFLPRVPGSIVALFGGTVGAWLLRLEVETIGTRFGEIPRGLPHFEIVPIDRHAVITLIAPAMTIAMLGAIESLLSAVVSDRMSNDQHNPNVELIAQGLANIASPTVGGLPATGAIARTATNVRSGAQTPVAGMIHALTLLGILLFAAPLAKYVPMAVLAAILLVTAYRMGEWREIPALLKLSWADRFVWLITCGLTILADLTVAVQFGMIVAALAFIRKVAATTTVSEVTGEYIEGARMHILQDKDIPPYVRIFRIHGPFLFGATDKINEIHARIDQLPPVVILRLRNMTAIDATGLLAFEDLADRLHASGRTLILEGMREQPVRLMQMAQFERHVGKDNICPSIQHAVERARAAYAEMKAKAAAI